jgi:uncharacterized protein
MVYTELTNKALRFAYAAHHGQFDYNGIPYIFHPLHLAEQMDDEVSCCAALLHDVDDHKLSPETSEGKLRALEFLNSHNVGMEKTAHIIRIIDTISFSANKGAPESIEGKCVQDADRLDAIGAIGIARTFAFGGSRGRAIHDPSGEDKTTSVQHFYDKLLLLKDRMNTATGKEIARQRHEYMSQFLEQFYGEWDGNR